MQARTPTLFHPIEKNFASLLEALTAAREAATPSQLKPTVYVDFSTILHVALGGLSTETLHTVAVALTAPSASALSALHGDEGIAAVVVLVSDLLDAFLDALDEETRGAMQWRFVFEPSSHLSAVKAGCRVNTNDAARAEMALGRAEQAQAGGAPPVDGNVPPRNQFTRAESIDIVCVLALPYTYMFQRCLLIMHACRGRRYGTRVLTRHVRPRTFSPTCHIWVCGCVLLLLFCILPWDVARRTWPAIYMQTQGTGPAERPGWANCARVQCVRQPTP
jgi:hypothetical protein